MKAYVKTIDYAKQKGLIVIGDVKLEISVRHQPLMQPDILAGLT